MLKAIRLNFQDGSYKDLPLSKATEVKTKSKMINLDQLKDGTWRLIYDSETVGDLSKLVQLTLVREEQVEIGKFKGRRPRTGQDYYDDHECA